MERVLEECLCLRARVFSPCYDLLQSMRTFIFTPSLHGRGADRTERGLSLLPVTYSPHTHTHTADSNCGCGCIGASVFTVLTCLFGQ